jgi:hypothetical protein
MVKRAGLAVTVTSGQVKYCNAAQYTTVFCIIWCGLRVQLKVVFVPDIVFR